MPALAWACPAHTLFLVALLLLASPLFAADTRPADKHPADLLTPEQVEAIEYADASVDNGFVTPLARDLSHMDDESRLRLSEFMNKIDDWKPGKEKVVPQRVRNLMAACCYADLGRAEFEAEIPYLIFERLKKDVPRDQLIQALAWVIIKPKDGATVIKAPELGINEELDEEEIRARSAIYAKKLLGRLVGKLPPKR